MARGRLMLRSVVILCMAAVGMSFGNSVYSELVPQHQCQSLGCGNTLFCSGVSPPCSSALVWCGNGTPTPTFSVCVSNTNFNCTQDGTLYNSVNCLSNKCLQSGLPVGCSCTWIGCANPVIPPPPGGN